jgi:hypothetical protein
MKGPAEGRVEIRFHCHLLSWTLAVDAAV